MGWPCEKSRLAGDELRHAGGAWAARAECLRAGAVGPALGKSGAAVSCSRASSWSGSEVGGGIRLVSEVSSCFLYFFCLVSFSLPLPTALLYKPIDRVTRSTLVLHVSVSP